MIPDMKLVNSYKVMTKVLTDGTKEYAKAISAITYNEDSSSFVSIDFVGSDEKVLNIIDEIQANKNTGIITFSTSDANYRVRDLRDEDGYWLSKYATPLPVETLEQLLDRESVIAAMAYMPTGEVPQDEALYALAYPDSDYVLGLLYTNELGDWARIDGQWLLLSAIDNSYDDTVSIELDPALADDFINLYDTKHVTIDDADQYKVSVEPVVED